MSVFTSRKPSLGGLAGLGGLWWYHPRYQGLVGHWWMGEGAGVVARDISPWGNHGVLTGSTLPTWENGQFGPVVNMDGLNDGVVVPNSVRYTPSVISVSFWARSVATAAQYDGMLFTSSTFEWIDGWGFWWNTPGPVVSFFTGNYFDSIASGTVTSTVWHHYVGTASSSTLSLYIDGALAASGARGVSSISSTGTLNIGFGSRSTEPEGSFDFNGPMDDVRVYNRELSPGEVVTLYKDPWMEFSWAEQVLGTLTTGEAEAAVAAVLRTQALLGVGV